MAEIELKTIETVSNQPFRKLVTTIGELPSAFIESMSYYEMLAWLVNWLENTVIPTVNNNAEAVEELQGLFVELKTFVDNYFENLDVQEEINNKLDQMTEDGTLQEIIAEYLNTKAVFGFDTVSDMQSATNLIDGSYAKTLGFHSKNDGGAALYKIREITNSDVIDNRFIISIGSNNLIAELITSSPVNICQVGGSQNFSSVCNALLSEGKSIYVPKLNFTADSTITITSNNTMFICDGNITFSDTNSVLLSVQSHRNKIEMNGRYTCGSSNTFLELGGGTNAWNNTIFINDVASSKIGILVNPNGAKGVQYARCTFNQINASEKGIYFNPGNDGKPWINANTFIGGELKAPYGVVAEKGSNQTDRFNDNYFQRIGFGGTITCALSLQFMQNCWFEHLRISEGLTGTYDIVIDNCINLTIDNEHTLSIPKINVINCSDSNYTTITARSFVDSGGNYICNKIIYVDNDGFVPKDNMWRYRTIDLHRYSDTNTELILPAYYFDDILVSVGADSGNLDLTYTLPDIFNRGVKSFYLLIVFKDATTSITVKTSGNTQVIKFDAADNERINHKLYYCEHSGKGSSNLPDWKVTEVTLING